VTPESGAASPDPVASLLERATLWLHRLEDAVLALLLGGMILLAGAQVALRNLFDSGISWADPLLSAAVLWVGLLGALAATRGDRQIRIDVLSRVLAPHPRALAHAATSLFAAGISAVIAWQGVRFLRDDLEFGGTAFAAVPSWAIDLVIPVAFAGIALRYTIIAAASLQEAARTGEPG
jgi:TRAP-type C4-dicarboxylate transport system permease small subunit